MIEIQPCRLSDCNVEVPGSKSYTHRMLIAAALSDGPCTILNPLDSEDTRLTRSALEQMGVRIDAVPRGVQVHGRGGRLKASRGPIFLGNSGTSMRLLTAVAALGEGTYHLTGVERMAERPIQDLLDSLNQLGVAARSVSDSGCPPVEVPGGEIAGGRVSIDCRISSQFLSGLLLIGPLTRDGLNITVTEGPVSRPYIDMTLDVMRRLGVPVQRDGYRAFTTPGRQPYRAGTYTVEPDGSQAGYFWAAGAISGAKVTVNGIDPESRQGDVRFTDVLHRMGCRVFQQPDGVAVAGGNLVGVEEDMSDMPDLVPTLAVVAAFAKGTTVIRNVAHLRAKESDRLAAVATELGKMGIRVDLEKSGLRIEGGIPREAIIETYGDHRIAMSFAIAGLRTPGVIISDEKCVEKSFPRFWKVLRSMYPESRSG